MKTCCGLVAHTYAAVTCDSFTDPVLRIDLHGGCAVYATATKASDPIGLAQLAEICAAVHIPVVAIGGITSENAAPCIQAGAAGVAVVSTLFATEDVEAAAAQLRAVVDEALSARNAQE